MCYSIEEIENAVRKTIARLREEERQHPETEELHERQVCSLCDALIHKKECKADALEEYLLKELAKELS